MSMGVDRCEAHHISNDVCYCMMKDSYLCTYAKSFGDALMCWHPDRMKFAERYDARRIKRP
jgi:hypothetical protein